MMRSPEMGCGAWRWLRAALLLVLIGAIGWVDYLTGPELSLSLFYLAPIIAAGWWLGAGPTALVGMVAACSWFIADLTTQPASHLDMSAWNGSTRLVIFLAMGLLTARIRNDREKLKSLLSLEQALSRTDPMTGLLNARGFGERLLAEASRSRRGAQPLCVAYLDVDNFKSVNDRYGHVMGDAMLKRIGSAIRETVREVDTPARLGGDEFAVLFWQVDREGARRIAHRIISRIHEVGASCPEVSISASVGIAWAAVAPESGDVMLARADAAMYEAKLGGKGQAVFHSDDDTNVGVMRASVST